MKIRDTVYSAEGMADLISQHGHLQAMRGTQPMAQATENHYCVRCRTKRDFAVEGEAKNKNGTKRRFGPCSVCGTKIHKMVSGKST